MGIFDDYSAPCPKNSHLGSFNIYIIYMGSINRRSMTNGHSPWSCKDLQGLARTKQQTQDELMAVIKFNENRPFSAYILDNE